MKQRRRKFLNVALEYSKCELRLVLGSEKKIDIKPAVFGRRSFVYFLEGLYREPLVLRLEFSKRTLKRRLKGHEILKGIGITVPRVVFFDLRSSTFKKYGAYFFVETFMAGNHFRYGLNSSHFGARLGRAVALMHMVSSRSYGWPGELRFPGRLLGGLKLIVKTREQLKLLREKDSLLANQISEWIRCQPSKLWFPKPRLTTGGFIASNLLVNEKDIVLLDLARVRYGFAARDLAQISFFLKDKDPIAMKMFLKSYKQGLTRDIWSEIKNYVSFFEVLFLLRLAIKGKHVNLTNFFTSN